MLSSEIAVPVGITVDLDSRVIAVIDSADVVRAGVAAWCGADDRRVRAVRGFQRLADCLAESGAVRPDVVVDPCGEAGVPDFAALRQLCRRDECVIVFSDLTADQVILTCLDLGAVTYLVKSEGCEHLLDAIDDVAAGRPHIGPRMARAEYAAEGRPARTKSALLAPAIEDGILCLDDL